MAVESEHKDAVDAPRPASLMKLVKPYSYLTVYYAAVGGVFALLLVAFPWLADALPVGGASDLVAVGQSGLEAAHTAPVAPSAIAESVRLALAIIGSFVLMLPVTWVCMGARKRKDVSQSFIQTILVLPLVITGVVHVVHNSLALAFSLAGIVAGVRFRHTLKDSAETTYLFTAIAVGVSCGINAVEVAAIISVFFNYTVIGLWATEYGGETTGKQMFSREWMAKGESHSKRKEEPTQARDEDDDED
jgi:hypothetical protein